MNLRLELHVVVLHWANPLRLVVVYHEPLPQGRLLDVVSGERKQQGAKLLNQCERGPSIVAVERRPDLHRVCIEFRPEFRPPTNFRVLSCYFRVSSVL
jgi:hypothetical protein